MKNIYLEDNEVKDLILCIDIALGFLHHDHDKSRIIKMREMLEHSI